MTSPGVEAMAVIDRELERTPPPDEKNLPYKAIDDVGDFDGEGGHRSFLFEVPVESLVNAERGEDQTVMSVRVVLRLKLSASGKNTRQHAAAVLNEGQLIVRRLNSLENELPAGLQEMLIRRWFTEVTGEGTFVRFEIDLITEETD